MWPQHLTNSSGGPVEAKASGDLIADMKEGILFINVIIIFPMKTKKKTCKSKNDVKLQKNMWGGQGVGWSHLRGPCRRKKPLPLARVEVVIYQARCSFSFILGHLYVPGLRSCNIFIATFDILLLVTYSQQNFHLHSSTYSS